MTNSRASAISALLTILTIVSTGCSRETAIYSDPTPVVRISPSALRGSLLPADFYDQSVNSARTDLQPDGVNANSKSISFVTSNGSSPSGAFNGNGTGSKSLLGLDVWEKLLTSAEPLTFDAKYFSGIEEIGVSMQLDLECNGGALHVVTALGARISAKGSSPQNDGYERFEASIHDAIWVTDGPAIINPNTSSELVPVMSGAPVSLDALLSRFPTACLKNGSTDGSELPLGVPTAGAQWFLGRASNTGTNSAFVNRISIGSDVYESFGEDGE